MVMRYQSIKVVRELVEHSFSYVPMILIAYRPYLLFYSYLYFVHNPNTKVFRFYALVITSVRGQQATFPSLGDERLNLGLWPV